MLTDDFQQKYFKAQIQLIFSGKQAILLVLGAVIFFVWAPMDPLFASNDDDERAMLETVNGEYEAYQKDVKGSLKFFRML